MDLQRLAYFVAVARHEHVTQAALALGITQPALSRSIAKLEADVGVPLFERQGRRLRLNRFGRTLAASAERAFAELRRGEAELADAAGDEHGTVALGFLHTLGLQIVPELIGAFRSVAPHVRFDLTQNAADTIYRQLADGKIDLCFAGPPPATAEIAWTELYREDLELAVPPHHPLAKRRSVRLAEVADEAFIALRPAYSLRQLSDSLCARAGFVPRIAFEGEEVATVRGLVAAGLGIALLPAAGHPHTPRDPPQVRIRVPRAYRSLGLAWRTDRYQAQAMRRFRAFVIERFAKRVATSPSARHRSRTLPR